ncbi:MAG TPA: WhiB family transcriptional regulator [Beutenbergiaceae bacterium]|nr:WhiB family transcriptional regulator [Beutenbergiaceae bacterium]
MKGTEHLLKRGLRKSGMRISTLSMRGRVSADRPYAWMDQGLCRKFPPEVFFPEKGNPGREADLAKQICQSCPVINECLEYALGNRDWFGVWGGTTGTERQAIHRG